MSDTAMDNPQMKALPIERSIMNGKSSIWGQIESYDNGLDRLNETISNLEARLNAVLASQTPSVEADTRPIAPQNSELASRASDLNTRLSYAIGRLSDITDRIDL
jgi:hypothetical protein